VPDRSRPGFLQGLRSVALQSVTINLPQAAYRAGGRNLPSTITEVEQAIRTAIRAHVEKRKFIGRLSASHQLPLWQLRRTVRDGQPYANLEDATVTIGLIGLSECLACAMGEELHTDPAAVQAGLALVETMARTAERLGLESGLRVRLEETPSENAARRLALIDARSFSLAASVLRGDPGADEAYYTNGAKLRTDAPVPFSRRLQIESRFHPAIEVHPLIQAYLAEPGPSPPEITAVLQRAFQETEAAQIAFTPRFTQCLDCRTMTRGVGSRCAACDSVNVTGLTRIADYFSRTTEWNRSKRAELQHRRLLQRLD
jgi:ribonucleoside-triphosphate reductase